MRRKRRVSPSSVERPPQSTEPGTGTAPATRSGSLAAAPVTRFRSWAAGSLTPAPPGVGPTVPREGSLRSRALRRRRQPSQVHLSAPASASTAAGEEVEPMLEPEETAGSFSPNSPIRVPYLEEYDSNGELCQEPSLFPDPVLIEPYEKAEQEFSDKIAKIRKLPTLDSDTSISPSIIQESAADTIIEASKFVLGLSSYIDGKLLSKCSGILIEWSKGTGIILTTAQLICSTSPCLDEWLGEDKYAPNAEVCVQLLHMDDFKTGTLMYLDKQYGFALFSVLMDEPKRLPCFSNERFAQDVFLLGRYESNLLIGNGKVLSKGAGSYKRHHYMYTDGHISPHGAGGAVINLEGDVTGMITGPKHFIPSSTIQKCLEIWKTYNHVPRIHLGMKLFGIKCLSLVSREKISRNYNIDAGLIVKAVSAESNAEKLGVRMGDIILSVNGEHIATAVELENKLLDISKAQLEKGIGLGSAVDVTLALDVFNTTKCGRGRRLLKAKLSRTEEIIEEGKYPVIYGRPKKPVEV
ncbi:unnamed protein product [Urochloa decumbens]|uniref:PDZ domain-containing protein n=1 Tax=Urochloa decumbens TaxID=240449 RepID=A0ABC9EQ39_9POAL